MPEGLAGPSKLLPLPEAIARFVEPGMQLCFASTPSRSNAAIRELARRFRGRRPDFALLATGFHSTAHWLGALRLGRRYAGCFFGDNYPTPRANRLYAELLQEGYELEHWSLWSYVSALAAGAFGHPYAITRSLPGTSIGRDLAARGKLVEVADPADASRRIALVRALTPDITFLHAPLGDEHGSVAFSPPFGEGFYGALAAKTGVIVTVERIVPAELLRGLPHLVPLPAHRLLAVCEEPFGAHPQPLHVAPRELREHEPGYADDFAAYRQWRALAEDRAALAELDEKVLGAADAGAAYRELVGAKRLSRLREAVAEPAAAFASAPVQSDLDGSDDLVLLAGRALARRVSEGGYRALLAGIGQSFAACRLAKLLLGERGLDVELMVETGFSGIDVEHADPFLLARSNVASAARLTSIESVLGALCCGGSSACIGVIGAAEVDVEGNVNSTSLGGQLLVGGGGAPDIAACAREVMVLTRADPKRLVRKVEYCTSRGDSVRTIVTEACVFERSGPGEPWIVREILASRADSLKLLLQSSEFRFAIPGPPPLAPAVDARELALMAQLRRAAAP
jgi:acyl CoA:acetate/3-ketoacid CoA transferase beta subunit/acyl CoA:acetate/3-ketoacid CoA transferase alpha subunit